MSTIYFENIDEMEIRCDGCAYLSEKNGEWFCEDWQTPCRLVKDDDCDVVGKYSPEEIEDRRTDILSKIDSFTGRSAWEKGVKLYAETMVDELFERIRDGYLLPDDIDSPRLLERALLNGAESWSESSWGGCYLIYNSDIAERLCTPSELKRTKNGRLRPNSREEWLDTQARALYQAAQKVQSAVMHTNW